MECEGPTPAVGQPALDLADYLAHDLNQFLRIEGLDQPARGTGSAALGLHGVAGLGGQHQDRRLGVLRHARAGS